MKSFLQFLEEQKTTNKHFYPAFETCFGHDEDKATQEDLAEAVSKTPGKKNAEDQVEEHSSSEGNKIHDDNIVKYNHYVKSYTGSDARGINAGLHHHHRHEVMGLKKSSTSDNDDYLSGSQKKAIKNIDAHLDKHTIKHDIHVFTGIPHSPIHAFAQQNAKKGESIKVHMPAYTSTTTQFSKAKQFAKYSDTDAKGKHTPINSDAPKKIAKKEKHVLKLHVPKGTKGGSVRNQSYYHDEHEILLHRGHNIEIHPHPTVQKDGTHVWHARVISHTPHKID